MKDKNSSEPEKQVSMPRPAYDIRTVGNGNADKWICKKCSEENESISQFCKNCGEYK